MAKINLDNERVRNLILSFIEDPDNFKRFEHIYANKDRILFLKNETHDRPALNTELPDTQLRLIMPEIRYIVTASNLFNDLLPYNMKLAIFRALMRIPRSFDGVTLVDYDIKAFKEELEFIKPGTDVPKYQQFM